MPIPSELWVKAYVRRCNGAGGMAVVARRGDAERGAILISAARLDGTAVVFGPAPGGDEAREHRFAPSLGDKPRTYAEVQTYLTRQAAMDPDVWIVEVEDRDGRHWLDDWLASGATTRY